MATESSRSLENALARTEADTATAIKAVQTLATTLKKASRAAQEGNLKEVDTSLEAVNRALAVVHQQIANTRDGWKFDYAAHMTSGQFTQELIAKAAEQNLKIFERDGRLYCYPALIRVSNDGSIKINKRLERKIRPSFLASRLKLLQQRPVRFKFEQFLAGLHEAYTYVVAKRPKELLRSSPVVPLVDLYAVWATMPGTSSEYPKEDFARDIYLLHKSGIETTRAGMKIMFSFSKGERPKNLSLIDEFGEEKLYYGVSFEEAKKG